MNYGSSAFACVQLVWRFVSQTAKLAVSWWQKFWSAWVHCAALYRHIRIPCCCSCGHSSRSIRRYMVLKYLMQGVRPCCTHSIVCCIFLWWHWSEVGGVVGGGVGNVIPHLYQLYVIMYGIVLCQCYRICVWHSGQTVNPTLLTYILVCCNVGICCCCCSSSSRAPSS
jgi:hypothetical protein